MFWARLLEPGYVGCTYERACCWLHLYRAWMVQKGTSRGEEADALLIRPKNAAYHLYSL